MATQALFSILTLPQHYSDGTLRFNVVFLPRNISPLLDLTAWGFPDVSPFAEAGESFNLSFKYIPDLGQLPEDGQATSISMADISVPDTALPIFQQFQQEFSINDIPGTNQFAPKPKAHRFIKKYLPHSYRNSFNFTNPRVKEAVTDDSYHCAFKQKGHNPNFKQTSDVISWGKVYAHCLRNPEIAKRAGLIYADLEISLPPGTFDNGGWIYADFDTSGYFATEIIGDQALANRYAARIPSLAEVDERPLFAPVLFPVTYGVGLSGIYDDQQREAADYDDGFAKITHGFQPMNTNFLIEEATEDMLPPTKDIGIRLAWDDEQLLIWQNRQMTTDPDAPDIFPMGVVNYKIDAREIAAPGDPENPWTSLNLVQARNDMNLGQVNIFETGQQIELGTEVFPNQLDGDQGRNYWLPAYFTQWAGKSLVLPDQEASEIYRTGEEDREYTDGDGNQRKLATNVQKPYDAVGLDLLRLRYGHQYEFRVRMGDISGGGPAPDAERLNEATAPDTEVSFKRYVAPNEVRMRNLPDDNDGDTPLRFVGESIVLRRPLLEYPNVVFADRYENPVDKIKSFGEWMSAKMSFDKTTNDYTNFNNFMAARKAAGIAESFEYGLPDPDVNEVEITVEVKALLMDNQLSVNRRESFIKLYTVRRSLNELNFAADINEEADLDPFSNIEAPTELAFDFRDANVLNFGDAGNFGDLNTTQAELDGISELILPTAREIRISIRSLGNEDNTYFGNNAWRKGKTIKFMIRQASQNEANLFNTAFEDDYLEGVYLQPDVEAKEKSRNTQVRLMGTTEGFKPSDMIQRLAQSLTLDNRKFSLIAENGHRAQFGCARAIRHSLSPDGTAVTFSTKADMLNHWLVTLNFRLARDWTWDAMDLEAFVVHRRKKFGKDEDWTSQEIVGTINLNRSINIQALQKPDRSYTQLVFIDAVEPKPDSATPTFPDVVDLQYWVEPKFKSEETPTQVDEPLILDITLPVTTIPAQIPKLASAGLALSPYKRDDKYANSEPRERHLWIELDEPIDDPNDELFIRFLAYSPDPLLVESKYLPDLMDAPSEPKLPIDPEWIRLIRPSQSDDNAGLNAMVELTPGMAQPGEDPRHFLVPIPPGLHAQSDELFGFFTYELRIGHKHIWSTAQGRFGRPLRVTGIQHPAPNLFCTTQRTEKRITVAAPYAQAVHEGRNLTGTPPKTEIWCLLYAQVKMADNQDFRNILLGEQKMGIRRSRTKLDMIGGFQDGLALSNKDAQLYGSTIFEQTEVELALRRLGLPKNSPLSVLCVEFLPTNPAYNLPNKRFTNAVAQSVDTTAFQSAGFSEQPQTAQATAVVARPLSRDLGKYRILRTSRLTEVVPIC